MHEETRKSRRRSRRGGRRSRRAEGHQAAQDAAELAPRAAVPDHPLIPAGPPEFVETDEALAEFIAHVRDAGSFAYDTEFIGEETYHPRICVVQLGTRERVALVDPLAGVDLGPVWEAIADPDLEIIVHAGQQDLEPVVRHLDRPPAGIVDTQITAAFVDRPYPLGLRQLVEEFVGVRLGKALTFTRWDRRPLSAVHARYAADDVRYLPAVHQAITDALERVGHTSWAAEECAALANTALYRFDPHARMIRIVGNRVLKPRRLAVLRSMIELRDEYARAHDQPPRTFLRDEVLLRLARAPVQTIDELRAVKHMPRPLADRYGSEIIERSNAALAAAPDDLPRLRIDVETPGDRVRIDSLWALASAYCQGRSVSPALVGNRARIAELHFAWQRGEEPDTELTRGWRHELVGRMLRAVHAGSATVELTWRDGHLRGLLRDD